MRKLIVIAVMFALNSGAYAGPAVEQLGSEVGVNAMSPDVQAPPAPADTKMIGCVENPMMPGCPKFCHTIGWGHPSCPPPLYCHTNPNGYGCPKSVGGKSVEAGDEELYFGIVTEATADKNGDCVIAPLADGANVNQEKACYKGPKPLGDAIEGKFIFPIEGWGPEKPVETKGTDPCVPLNRLNPNYCACTHQGGMGCRNWCRRHAGSAMCPGYCRPGQPHKPGCR